METHSLVLVKSYEDTMEIETGDILVFLANRFGEQLMMMHRFSHTEVDETGEMVYRTHPEGSDTLDQYETKREDIVGIYVCHIPYVGKWIVFFKSAFGFLWVCQMTVILLVKKWVLAKWEEKEKCTSSQFP